jgi:hypothetical protein
MSKHGRGLAEAEIALPSLKVAAELANHGLDPYTTSSTSKGSDSSLEPGLLDREDIEAAWVKTKASLAAV